MTAFERRFTDQQRQAIYELKEAGKSGTQVVKLCRQGIKGLDPFEVTKDTVNRVYREERVIVSSLTHSPLAEKERPKAAEDLTSRQITLLDRTQTEIQVHLARGKCSPLELERLSKTLDRVTTSIMRLRREFGPTTKP